MEEILEEYGIAMVLTLIGLVIINGLRQMVVLI